jgi:hypothetical protein
MATLKDLFELANEHNLPPSTEIVFVIGGRRIRPVEVNMDISPLSYAEGRGNILKVIPSEESIDEICRGKMNAMFQDLVAKMF